MILYNKKAKCQGCKALTTGKDDNGLPKLSCSLGYRMDFQIINNNAVQPKPKEKCYKPLTADDYAKAKELSVKKVDQGADA